MSPLVMFNHLLFVNTFPARSLSQSAPGPLRDPETENIPGSFSGLLDLPRAPEGEAASAPPEGLPGSPKGTFLKGPSCQAGQGGAHRVLWMVTWLA